jgi:hypothetical protein
MGARMTGWHVAEDSSDPQNYKRAVFHPRYFSEGALRYAYKGEFTHPSSLCGNKIVVKRFKSSNVYNESDWQFDVKTSKKARELAKKFNATSHTYRPISFNDIIPLKVCGNSWWDNTSTPVDAWIAAEHFLEGDYTKWLANNGWVSEDVGVSLPAFSHWTWVETNGEVLVCDLQGVRDIPSKGYWLTDPAILSPGREYGSTDIGNAGIHNFFASHKCTTMCRSLGIDKKCPSQRHLRPSKGLVKRGSSYSAEKVVQKRIRRFLPRLDVIQELPTQTLSSLQGPIGRRVECQQWEMTQLARPITQLASPTTQLASPTTQLASPTTQLASPTTQLASQTTQLTSPTTQPEEANQPCLACCCCFGRCHANRAA